MSPSAFLENPACSKMTQLSRIWARRRSSLPCCGGQGPGLFRQCIRWLAQEVVGGEIILGLWTGCQSKARVPVTEALGGLGCGGKGLARMPHFQGPVAAVPVPRGCVTDTTKSTAQSPADAWDPHAVSPRLRSGGSGTVGLSAQNTAPRSPQDVTVTSIVATLAWWEPQDRSPWGATLGPLCPPCLSLMRA